MEYDLRECIEELQKSIDKVDNIFAKIIEEGSNYKKRYFDERKEFEQYVAKEKRDLARRLAGERKTFEAKQVVKGNEFNEKIKLMREETVKLHEKIDSLGKIAASVRLGDLVDELANLARINTSEIKVDTFSNIMIDEADSTEEMYKFWGLMLHSSSFHYEMILGADLNSVQADGKTFFEHCSARPIESRTCLNVNINPDDLIANIPLSYLTGKDDFSWYPDYLIRRAVINCVERSQEKEVSKDNVKKRSRKLSDETKKVEVND